MKYKRATAPLERPTDGTLPHAEEYEKKPYLTITQWSVADVDGDLSQCGLAGSPTKLKPYRTSYSKPRRANASPAATTM